MRLSRVDSRGRETGQRDNCEALFRRITPAGQLQFVEFAAPACSSGLRQRHRRLKTVWCI